MNDNGNILRVFTAFSGYDSQCMALDRLGIPYELVGWSEIDRYAIRSHNAVYPQWSDRNWGDISAIDWNAVPDFDLFTYSFPCTDISSAGRQAGLTEGSGTRSSLLWECRKAIEAKRPEYLLMENVKNLVSKKFKGFFREWEQWLAGLGYANYWKVLNAKGYGVPQNRERVFLVSILGDAASYRFPDPFPLERRLEHVLERNADEKYYLSEKALKGMHVHNEKHKKKGTGFLFKPKTGGEIANCIRANAAKSAPTDNAIMEPVICAMRGRNPESPSDRTAGTDTEQRLEIGGDISNALTTVQKDNLLIEPVILGYTKDKKGKVVDRHVLKLANTVHSSTGSSGNTDQFACEPVEGIKILQRGRGFNKGGEHDLSPAITGSSWQDNNLLASPVSVVASTQCGAFVGSVDSVSPCINAACGMGGGQTPMIAYTDFRIRRLTPRECFRLMDVPEECIDRIQASGISNTQQYRMAGNSIVVNVLYHIFRRLFIDTEIKDTLF